MSELKKDGQYCMYLRKSRADREAELQGEGETLARHRKILQQTALQLQINISRYYEEVRSGEMIASRPVMQELLSSIEQGLWDGVLVVEVERLARGDTIDQGIVSQAFQYTSTKIITPNKIYDPNNEFDEEYFEFGLFMSRREYKTINRRLQAGRLSSVNEGKYVGNKPPYGYQIVKLEQQKGYTLAPSEKEAKVVVLLFELYLYGESGKQMGIGQIASRLNYCKIPSATGKEWTASSVRKILSNPVYIGLIRWNARKTVKKTVNGQIKRSRPNSSDAILRPGLHPAIIEERIYETVQKKLKLHPTNKASVSQQLKNPLASLVICGNCGKKMIRRPYSNGPDLLLCQTPSCPTVASPLSYVEKEILFSLRYWGENYSISKNHNQPKVSPTLNLLDSQLHILEENLEKAYKQKDTIYSFFEEKLYSKEEFCMRSDYIDKRIFDLYSRIEVMNKTMEREKEITATPILPPVAFVFDFYEQLDIELRNMILKEFLAKVVYIKDKKNTKGMGNTPSFSLILYPQLKRL